MITQTPNLILNKFHESRRITYFLYLLRAYYCLEFYVDLNNISFLYLVRLLQILNWCFMIMIFTLLVLDGQVVRRPKKYAHLYKLNLYQPKMIIINIAIQIMELVQTGSYSKPALAVITNIGNSILKNRYVVYYQIPIYQQLFKPIDDMKQILIISNTLKFKILDLQAPYDQPSFAEGSICINNANVSINLRWKAGQINITGIIINKAINQGIVFSLSVSDISGYLNFLKFRQKYRTLQNITRKQNFKLDHRLKVIDGSTTFYFPLQESDHSCYFFTSRKLIVQIQQIYSVEEWNMVQNIYQEQLDLGSVNGSMASVINILQKLKVTLNIEAIKNANYTASQIACIRILQVFPACGEVKIGTDKINHLADVKPVLANQFYDYQFGYLNQNISSMSSSNDSKGLGIYQHLNKLSKSFPNYPHLKNSKIIDIQQSKFLIFTYQNKNKIQIIKVPLVYNLEGLNIIENQNCTIKYFIQFNGEGNRDVTQKQEDIHRIYDLKLKDIWNLGQACQKYKQFIIKIVSPGINYSIPFNSSQVDANQYKKEVKQLTMKQQYGEFEGRKYYVILPTNHPNKLQLSKTQSINDVYVIDLYNSSSITFQLISKDDIKMQGILLREQLIKSRGALRVVLSSHDSLSKVILTFQATQIKQKNQSFRTFYQLMYKLQFTENIPCDNLQYNLQIERLTDRKKYKAKVSPQIADDGISTLHHLQGGFFQATADDLQINLNLRKMYYSEQTETFDNGEVINRKIIINTSPKQALQQNCMFLTLKQQGYASLKFDFYDENVKKRFKLYFEVYMRKLSLLDLEQGRYTIKIPQALWKINNFNESIKSITMQTHLSHKRKKGQKITIFIDSPQQYILPHCNYKDGLSLIINGQIGYEKMLNAIKVKCDISKEGIIWFEQSEWYLGIVNVNDNAFYFMIKYGFDPNANASDDSQASSAKSAKTQSNRRSERSNSQKIDPLAKTVVNFELLKLKKLRNDLVLEGRNLTTKYVQRQQMIINFKKKLSNLQQKIQKIQAVSKLNPTDSNVAHPVRQAKTSQKMKQFYRSICQCGARNPKYNGFCQICLKQLRKKYEVFLRQYSEKSLQYQKIQFEKFNSKEKYRRAKNKLRLYKQKLKAGEDIEDDGVSDILKQLQQGNIKRLLQDNRIELFRLQQERQKQQTSSKLRLNSLQDMIRKEDTEIWQYTTQLQMVKQQLDELNLKISKQRKSKNM